MGIRWLNVSTLIGVFALTSPCAAPLVLAGDLPAQDATAPPTAKPAKPAKSAKPKRVCTLSPPTGGSAIPGRSCHTVYPPEEEQQAEAPETESAEEQETMDTVSTEEGASTGDG